MYKTIIGEVCEGNASPKQDLEVAYHSSLRASDVAKAVGVSHIRYVRLAQFSVAISRLEAQNMLLDQLCALCEIKPPSVACESLK